MKKEGFGWVLSNNDSIGFGLLTLILNYYIDSILVPGVNYI